MNYGTLNKLMGSFSTLKFFTYRTAATKTVITAEGKDVPKRKNIEPRITLIGTDNSVSITDLKNAQSLSMRRELKLVKIQDEDAKTRRPIYKLMTTSEYHSEELAKRKEKQIQKQQNSIKGEKLVTLSSRIGEHDLMTGVKKMVKLLEKQYEVKVVISGEDAEAAQKTERIYSVIDHHIKSIGKVVQKRIKGNNLRFQLLPTKDMSSNSSPDSEQKNDKSPL